MTPHVNLLEPMSKVGDMDHEPPSAQNEAAATTQKQ
jgi:hypothetical protein